MNRLQFHACLKSSYKTFAAMRRTPKIIIAAVLQHTQGTIRNDQKPIVDPSFA
jgi:hypothetical protein